ncbi:hypothetical protein WN944_005323 [Citrus x changshan-huyou]|uniref:Uncharacterized protein n=1 Tax=Citrus x changshan-huyou TaxID=2935761 RepID=A0AAP0M3L2_9ROSI
MNTRKGEDDDHSSAWAILDNILGRLAVKDEVKTSFRNLVSLHPKNYTNNTEELAVLIFLAHVISHVLLSHRGPINTFKLSIRNKPLSHHFDSWIQFLSGNGIKELTLEQIFGDGEDRYRYVYETQALIHC